MEESSLLITALATLLARLIPLLLLVRTHLGHPPLNRTVKIHMTSQPEWPGQIDPNDQGQGNSNEN